jgi:circadian clock protein KaiC
MDKERVSTGIPGLDPLIDGGFPRGKSFLLTGPPGSGKSIFCLQFLVEGLTKGEKAVYVAVDEKPTDVVEQAASLGWDLARHIDTKELLVLDSAPYFTSRVGGGREKEVDIQKFVADLTNYVKRMEATRLVIDPVGPVILLRDSMSRIQDQARRLVHSLQNHLQTTNLLTCYPVPRVGEKSEHGVEEYLVAGVIYLSMQHANKRIARTLSIRKMRSTSLDLSEVEFKIVKGNGIILEEPQSK